MNVILNRNFELPSDGWYQLAPLGEFPHGGAGINQVIDTDACTRMVAAFENARSQSENFPGLLIDFDHFSLDAEKHSEAAGWITDLKFVPPVSQASCLPQSASSPATSNHQPTTGGSPSGLFAAIRWTDTGEAAVKGGRYRFLSPVWARSDCEEVYDDASTNIISEGNRAKPGSRRPRLRPIRLLNAAVTNDPNLKGILPLSNRSESPSVSSAYSVVNNTPSCDPLVPSVVEKMSPVPSAGDGPFDFPLLNKTVPLTPEELMKAIVNALLKKLDLPPEADAEIIQSAIENITPPGEVEALLNRAEIAESKINDLEKVQLEADADSFLDEHADVIENRDEVRAQFIENRTVTEALFKNLKAPSPQPPVPSTSSATRKPLHNRESKIKATHNRDAQTGSEAHAVKIRNRASEIMKDQGVPYTDAFRRAEQEMPE